MAFGAAADFQDAARRQIARLLEIKDIVEEESGKEIDKGRAGEILDQYRQYERFNPEKEYLLDVYEEV